MTISSATDQRDSVIPNTAGACNCKAEVNAMLAEHNTQLDFNYLNERDILIRTIRLNEKKRNRPAVMFATFCPFCGESLAPATLSEPLGDPSNADETKG